jgi:uncharacterized membrane-anchored protein
MFKKLALGITLSVGMAISAQAQTAADNNSISNLDWQIGVNSHQVQASNAVIRTSEDEAFLKGKHAWKFARLTEGHDRMKPDALIYKLEGPLADSIVYFRYLETGYLKMDDWSQNIDAEKIIQTIRNNTAKANQAKAAGYGKLYVDGWVEKPYLDKKNAIVYWAIRGHSEDGQKFVNAKAIKLGRKGMSTLVWVGSPAQFQGASQNLQPALQAYKYQNGFRYADFRPGVDTVAAVGIGAIAYKMMTGKSSKAAAAAGSGALAVIALLAKKLWFVLLLPFVYAWGVIKRLLS